MRSAAIPAWTPEFRRYGRQSRASSEVRERLWTPAVAGVAAGWRAAKCSTAERHVFTRIEANRRRLGGGLRLFSYTPLLLPVCVNSFVLLLGHHLRVFRGGFTTLRNRFHMMQLFPRWQFAARIALLLYDSGYFASGPFSFDLRYCRLAHVCAHLVAGLRVAKYSTTGQRQRRGDSASFRKANRARYVGAG